MISPLRALLQGRLAWLTLVVTRTIRLALALENANILPERIQLAFGNLLLLLDVLEQFENEVHVLLRVLQRFDDPLGLINGLLDRIHRSALVHRQRWPLFAGRLRSPGLLVSRATIVTSRKIAAVPVPEIASITTAVTPTIIGALVGPTTAWLITWRTIFSAGLTGRDGRGGG